MRAACKNRPHLLRLCVLAVATPTTSTTSATMTHTHTHTHTLATFRTSQQLHLRCLLAVIQCGPHKPPFRPLPLTLMNRTMDASLISGAHNKEVQSPMPQREIAKVPPPSSSSSSTTSFPLCFHFLCRRPEVDHQGTLPWGPGGCWTGPG